MPEANPRSSNCKLLFLYSHSLLTTHYSLLTIRLSQDLTEKKLGPRVLRMSEEIRRRVRLDDLPRIHEDDAVGHFPGKAHFVGDDEHRHAFPGEVDHGVEHFLYHFRVERRGRLVKQHDLWIHGQGPCDGHPLLLSAGQLRWIFAGLVRDLDPLQIFHCRGFGVLLRNVAHPDRRQCAVLEHGQVREQVKTLEDHPHLAADLVDPAQLRTQFDSVDDDPSLLKLYQSIDATNERGFSRP